MMSATQTQKQQDAGRLWRLAAMGGTLASEILAGTLIGWLLDKLFNTDPTLLIIGTILGLIIGMITFIRSALKASKEAGQVGRRFAAEHPRKDE